jgi:2,4-dienoyl-CoA reductase-like NADH-dependent reductase (Old Yellow Enzyme family)/thioredoxin reductase
LKGREVLYPMANDHLKRLFSPIRIHTLEVKNRIVMPPMCTAFATIRGEVNDRLIAYYAERAKGGVGLINVEFTAVSPVGKVFDHMTGLYDDGMIPGFKKLVDAVHDEGAKAAIQLSHAGRRTHSTVIGEVPVAPSAVPRLNGEVPRELSIDEIQTLIHDFVRAASRAKKAGFDAVMIHMAHGYLINQFLSPLSNRRQDRYGGDLEGRSRFAIEILQRTRAELGPDFPITCRFCADEYLPGGFDLDQSTTVAKKLEEEGIDAIDISAGTHETDYIMSAPSNMPPGFLTHLSEAVKEVVSVPVGIVGRINDPILAEKILADGKADFISMGRSLIADPELPIKGSQGRLDEIRPCTSCNLGCNDRMYFQLDITCQTNPMVGREMHFKIKPAEKKKRVLVIGGGPAGLEAARVAALRGHEVLLYEKGKRLGGQLNLAAVPPEKDEYGKLVQYYERQMGKLGVNTVYMEANKEEILKVKPDVVVLATGGRPNTDIGIKISNSAVVGAWELLAGEVSAGEKVVIVGGGQIGCETADFLLDQSKEITILEMTETVASDMSKRARKLVLDKLVRNGVEILKRAFVKEILDAEIIYESMGLTQKIKGFDHVVLAVGTVPDRALLEEVGDLGVPVFSVGDCVSPRRAIEAIREGFEAALDI